MNLRLICIHNSPQHFHRPNTVCTKLNKSLPSSDFVLLQWFMSNYASKIWEYPKYIMGCTFPSFPSHPIANWSLSAVYIIPKISLDPFKHFCFSYSHCHSLSPSYHDSLPKQQKYSSNELSLSNQNYLFKMSFDPAILSERTVIVPHCS